MDEGPRILIALISFTVLISDVAGLLASKCFELIIHSGFCVERLRELEQVLWEAVESVDVSPFVDIL